MIFRLFNDLTSKLKKQQPLLWLVQLGVVFIILFCLNVVAFQFAENVSWEEAFWQSWQTFTTVGYGNRPAETTLGRWVTVILCTLGIAILGALFSAFFDYKVHLSDIKRLGYMKNPYKDGYVIFNFPGENQLINFVKEIRDAEKNVGVCVVDSSLEELPKAISLLRGIHFIKGNPLSRETYENAGLKENKAIIIFPTEPNVSDSDGATKTIVDLVSKFVENQTRVLHILVDPANAWMFDDVNSTQVLESFELFALVQECQDKYSAEIIEQLLLNSKGSNPQTLSPELVIGWTWNEFLIALIKASAMTGIKCSPFAIIRNGEPEICPDYESKIQEGDLLSLITYNDFDWRHFEKKMVEFK
ncbi:potassium channel protein [Flexithrix dorotheae]|uniref:potassium channel protein n=1 Tax=Flexithrix dorotheae TaxID=70993 RepID=UPI00037B0AE3|nr:potassium channel family protein [Flexithrix dorotheae]